MPAKWRTKSGCLTCRLRRKKCDEDGQICRACRRNHLTCVWGSTRTLQETNSGTLKQSNQGQDVALPEVLPKTPKRDALFRYFASTVLPELLIPGSPSSAHGDLLTLGAQHFSLRDSFLAFGALFLTNSSQPQLPNALCYYSEAVRSIREMIEQSKLIGTEDWLFVLTLSLCIFERAQPGQSCGAVSHLLGASRIMALKLKCARELPPESITPMQQMCASSLLYHAATTAFLSTDIIWLPEDVSWEQVEHFIGPKFTSPFAMPPSLCRLILEISRLARRTPFDHQDALLAASLRKQLDMWLSLQPSSEAHLGERGPLHTADETQKAAGLYAMAADILLLKVMQPGILAEDSRVQSRVRQILNLLQTDVRGLFWNQHYSWPFAIVGCAVQRETEMLFLIGRLEKMWERSHWGDIKRTSSLLKNMLRFKKLNHALQKGSKSNTSWDPFDFLLHADGLSKFASL